MLYDFFRLIFPQNCISCGNNLYKHEDQLCNFCKSNLPKTNFHLSIKNPVDALFHGRVPLKLTSSFYTFTKEGSVQKILHAIKYKHNKELAILIGKLYADDIKELEILSDMHYIIPVPLHPKKLKSRGFNQSEEFAFGLSQGLNIPVNTTCLQRAEFTTTQTKKNKYERWENVEDKFVVKQSFELENKHVILVDDVITTGATIEACCSVLQQVPGIKISVLSMAYASF